MSIAARKRFPGARRASRPASRKRGATVNAISTQKAAAKRLGTNARLSFPRTSRSPIRSRRNAPRTGSIAVERPASIAVSRRRWKKRVDRLDSNTTAAYPMAMQEIRKRRQDRGLPERVELGARQENQAAERGLVHRRKQHSERDDPDEI